MFPLATVHEGRWPVVLDCVPIGDGGGTGTYIAKHLRYAGTSGDTHVH